MLRKEIFLIICLALFIQVHLPNNGRKRLRSKSETQPSWRGMHTETFQRKEWIEDRLTAMAASMADSITDALIKLQELKWIEDRKDFYE